MLTPLQILQLSSFSVIMAAGQIFFKLAAMQASQLNSLQNIMLLAFNRWLWCAVILYGIATLLWVSILQTVPLSRAYPFTALGFVVVALLSHFMFQEKLTWHYGLGVMLILIALTLITQKS